MDLHSQGLAQAGASHLRYVDKPSRWFRGPVMELSPTTLGYVICCSLSVP